MSDSEIKQKLLATEVKAGDGTAKPPQVDHKDKAPSEYSASASSMASSSSLPALNTDSIRQFIDTTFGEDFIIIESEPEGISGAIRKVLGDVTSASAGRQVAIGGVTGYVAGYLTSKIGRAVGLSLAGTFIIFQVAQHKGYIKVDWAKMKRALTKAELYARRETLEFRRSSSFGNIRTFAEENFFLTSGFLGGFGVGFFF